MSGSGSGKSLDSFIMNPTIFGSQDSPLYWVYYFLFPHIMRMIDGIEKQVFDSGTVNPISRIQSSSQFQMMAWAMFSNIRRCVGGPTSKLPHFHFIKVMSLAYRMSTSSYRFFLLKRLTCVKGDKISSKELLISLSKKVMAHSLSNHTDAGTMISFLNCKFKHSFTALVTRGPMNGSFFDILLSFMHCDVTNGFMKMPGADSRRALKLVLNVLPQLHPEQIEMIFHLHILNNFILIVSLNIDSIKESVCQVETSDGLSSLPWGEPTQVIGSPSDFMKLDRFEAKLHGLYLRVDAILRRLNGINPGLAKMIDHSLNDVNRERDGAIVPDYPINLSNLESVPILIAKFSDSEEDSDASADD